MKLVELAVGNNPELSFSPFVWRTKMALAHKGFDPEIVTISFADKAALGPSGSKTVPALEDNGKWITDSWDIACYLEDTYPDRPGLFGDASERALIRFFNNWTDSALLMGLFPILVMDIYGLLDEENQACFRSARETRLGRSLEEFAADRDRHIARFKKSLSPLQHTLKNQSFVAGDQPGYADYAAFGAFQWARCACPGDLLEAEDPIYRWRENMLDLYDGLGRKAARCK